MPEKKTAGREVLPNSWYNGRKRNMHQKTQSGETGTAERKLRKLIENGFANTGNPWESTKERKTGALENLVDKRSNVT